MANQSPPFRSASVTLTTKNVKYLLRTLLDALGTDPVFPVCRKVGIAIQVVTIGAGITYIGDTNVGTGVAPSGALSCAAYLYTGQRWEPTGGGFLIGFSPGLFPSTGGVFAMDPLANLYLISDTDNIVLCVEMQFFTFNENA